MKLKINKGYSRHIGNLYRVIRKLYIIYQKNIGVKYVPKVSKSVDIPKNKNFYQYTCIDEVNHEKFLFWYEEHIPMNTVDFIKRCIVYYDYKSIEIQINNGTKIT